MPVITSIKQQKNKDRVNVYLDDKFGFGIDLTNFAILNLRVDQELTEKEVEEIVKKSEFQKTLDKLLRFSMVRPRSEKEITDYFKRKKVHESMHINLIERLKHFELLDDKKFANWWISQRIQFKSRSKNAIKQELIQKGIDRNVIEDAFSEINVDEEKMIKNLISKREYRWRGLNPEIRHQKITQYLLGRGFKWDTVNGILATWEFEEPKDLR